MAKLYNFGYKGADRSVYKLTSEHQVDSPVTSISGIDLSHLSEAEKAEFKAELDRHDAAMQRFIKTAYRKFLVKDMDSNPVETNF